MRLTHAIVARTIPGPADPQNPQVRLKVGLLEGWISVWGNTLLFGLKLWLGLVTGSVSLIADALHTLSDSFTSIVVIFGFRMAVKPADAKHPFGHGRMESIAAIVIGSLLGVVALETFRAALNRLLHPQPLDAAHWIIAVVAATIFVKEVMARFSMDLGRMINSQALIADGWHHRSDVLATALFIAAHWPALYWMDGAMGVGVSIMIAWAGFETLRSSVDPLLGERAPEEMYEEIEKIASATQGVRGVHDMLVQRYGTLNIISLHVEVSAAETALHLHEISEHIEGRIAQRWPGHAIVHVDPVNLSHPHYDEVRKLVSEALAAEPGVSSFHDLRLVGGIDRFRVVLDAATSPAAKQQPSTEQVQARVEEKLRARFPKASVHLEVEPPYFRNAPDPEIDDTKKAGK